MFVDTCIFAQILLHDDGAHLSEEIYKAIGADQMFISVVQIAEISSWCINEGYQPEKYVSHIRDIVNVIPLDEVICIEAAKLRNEIRSKGNAKFGIMDAIILASARSIGERLLTLDHGFRKSKDVYILD